MLAGTPPHNSSNKPALLKMIVEKEPPMKAYFSADAKDLLTKLLTRNV